ncbi:hypothetical protein [Actinocorallia libanotica]
MSETAQDYVGGEWDSPDTSEEYAYREPEEFSTEFPQSRELSKAEFEREWPGLDALSLKIYGTS